jgi:hypothetical protein
MQGWMNNNKINLKDIGCEDAHWIDVWRLLAGFCEHGNERCGHVKGGKCLCYLRVFQMLKLAPLLRAVSRYNRKDSDVRSDRNWLLKPNRLF